MPLRPGETHQYPRAWCGVAARSDHRILGQYRAHHPTHRPLPGPPNRTATTMGRGSDRLPVVGPAGPTTDRGLAVDHHRSPATDQPRLTTVALLGAGRCYC